MKSQLKYVLVVSGLLAGLWGLLPTTRNLIRACYSPTYTVVSYYNRVHDGELILDILAAITIWGIWVVGLYLGVKNVKEVETT